MVGILQTGSEIRCPEVWPEDVVPQQLLVLQYRLPVAALHFRVRRPKRRALCFNIVRFDRRSIEWRSAQQGARNESM